MNPAQLDAIAKKLGILNTALVDVRNRVQAHFADQDPTPEALQSWLETTLYQAAPHLWASQDLAEYPWQVVGVPEEVWKAASPSQKLTWAREDQPPPVQRRPQPLTLSEAQVAQMQALPPAERLTEYRRLQAEQTG
jgi:hypothetical protein